MRKPRRSQVLKRQVLRVTTVRTGIKGQSSLTWQSVSTEIRAKITLTVDTLKSLLPELWEGKCLLSRTFTHLYNTHFLSRRHNQYTSKQHITGLTNTGTKMRKAGTSAAPMSACFIDRVGRLQVIVIHCSVHASQGGKDLWHKDPLKKYALCIISAHRERHGCLYSHPGKDLIVSSRVLNDLEVISSLRTLTRITPCQALWQIQGLN